MKNEDIEEIISVLRRTGMSREFCDEIRKNADAGGLDYALELIQGEDNCVGGVQSKSFKSQGRGLLSQSYMRRIRY